MSVPQGHNSPGLERQISRGWEGWGRADTLAVGNSSTFSLKAYEALIENPDGNRRYLEYVINIS